MELQEELDPSCFRKSDLSLLDIIGNPTRRKILTLLSCEPHYASQLSRLLKISQPAIVKQLRILEEAGLTISEKQQDPGEKGPERLYYSIASEFILVFSLGANYAHGRCWATESRKYTNENILPKDIPPLNEIAKQLTNLEQEIVSKEQELVQLETKRNKLFHHVLLMLQNDKELKTAKAYLQRAIIRALLMCDDKVCIDELANSLEKGEAEIIKHLKKLGQRALVEFDLEEEDVRLPVS